MEELSKKDILTLIGENLTTIRRPGYKGFDEGTELEEMPEKPEDYPKMGPPDPTKPTKRSKGRVKTWTRLYETNEDGKVIDHVGWYRYDEQTEKATPIIFTCQWDELIAKHPDLIPKLKEKYGEVNLVEKDCPAYDTGLTRGNKGRLVIKPLPGEEGEVINIDGDGINPYDSDGNTKTTYTTEKIKRSLNQILKDELEGDDEFKNALKRASLPEILIMRDKHRNRYSEVNDKEITFQTQNINLYKSQKEFIRMTQQTVVKGQDPEFFSSEDYTPKKSHHMRRQYNKEYSNWSKTRFTQQGGYGKTPVFNLDRGDFPEEDFTVMVSSDLEVKGIARTDGEMTTGFVWELEYKVDYAKKSPTDRVARQIMKDEDVSVKLEVPVELSEPKDFDGKTEKGTNGKIEGGDKGNNHPLTDVNIVQGLKEILSQFKENMKGKKQLALAMKRARMSREDVRQMAQRNLNESEIRKIVKKTLNKTK